MVHAREGLVVEDAGAYLAAQEAKGLLRFITCGSVDDGKSTLIGRLLYESHLIFDDHLAALAADSRRVGTQGNDLDLALVVDGLAAEREQGITIDVAYRFFTTERRKFIVADTPGHEQYTRNMVTGASNAELAVILVDARKGVLTQTRRHTYIVSLLGIDKVVLAVNKLDLVGYSQEVFRGVVAEYTAFAENLGVTDIVSIPMSALRGDNVVRRSENTPWYAGPTLIDHLETVDVEDEARRRPFRMAIQWVSRPHPDFRGFSGMISAGSVRVGDCVRILPSNHASSIEQIHVGDALRTEATAGQAVTVVLADEIDVGRGDVLADDESPAGVADQFEGHVVWMHEQPMLPGRSYLMKIGTTTVGVAVSQPRYKVNVNTLERMAGSTLGLNEIGVCTIATDRPIAFDPYRENRDTGGFVVIDRFSDDTVGAGLIHFALRRSHNVRWQPVDVTAEARSTLMGHCPVVVWFTGLSGAGKSTIANVLERQLHSMGIHTYLLDGDNVRHGLNRDLGFTDADRVENIRRVAEVAALMADAGLVVIASFISPFRAERRLVRERLPEGQFCEVFVDTPLATAEARDPKGLYEKARAGRLPNFTGIDSPYEQPESPEIRIDTLVSTPQSAAEEIVDVLRRMGVLDVPITSEAGRPPGLDVR